MDCHPIYIILATHRRPDLLERSLKSLAECQIPDAFVETLIVENGGEFGARSVVERASSCINPRYLFSPEGNKSAALNLAMQQVADPNALVIFLDDDVRLNSDVLIAYHHAAREHGIGHYFGGPFSVDYEKPPETWLLPYLPPSAVGWSLTSKTSDHWKFVGFNWAAFAQDLRSVGDFDETRGPSLAATGQETEMQFRLVSAGVRPIYLPDAWVWHYVPAERCSPEWTLARARRQGAGATKVQLAKGIYRPDVQYFLLYWHLNPRRHFWSLMSRLTGQELHRFRADFWKASGLGVTDVVWKNGN